MKFRGGPHLVDEIKSEPLISWWNLEADLSLVLQNLEAELHLVDEI